MKDAQYKAAILACLSNPLLRDFSLNSELFNTKYRSPEGAADDRMALSTMTEVMSTDQLQTIARNLKVDTTELSSVLMQIKDKTVEWYYEYVQWGLIKLFHDGLDFVQTTGTNAIESARNASGEFQKGFDDAVEHAKTNYESFMAETVGPKVQEFQDMTTRIASGNFVGTEAFLIPLIVAVLGLAARKQIWRFLKVAQDSVMGIMTTSKTTLYETTTPFVRQPKAFVGILALWLISYFSVTYQSNNLVMSAIQSQLLPFFADANGNVPSAAKVLGFLGAGQATLGTVLQRLSPEEDTSPEEHSASFKRLGDLILEASRRGVQLEDIADAVNQVSDAINQVHTVLAGLQPRVQELSR